MAAGSMLAKAFMRAGYQTLAQNEYPSLIRGGHNVITLRIAVQPFTSLLKKLDILIALNAETVVLHKNELHDQSVVVFDPKDQAWKAEDFSIPVTLVAMPLSDIAKQLGGEPVMRNTIALGATIALFGAELQLLESVIRDQFVKKGEKIIQENIQVAKAGYDFIKKTYSSITNLYLEKGQNKTKQFLMNASEAIGLGAIASGVKFAAIYPMTPINALINFFADYGNEHGVRYQQPEDEISGINMAIGASLSGAKSMVATSGGGFALMVEGLSMAGIMEVPLVIDLGMRPGPATGMPTWTEQGELQFAIRAGHGEFPRVVLAPGDIEEAFALTVKAFELSQTYQIPVFILTDKYINENQWCAPASVFIASKSDKPKPVSYQDLKQGEWFKRYSLTTENGISPRSIFGELNGQYLANSYEHDEMGFTTEDASMRTKMVNKRMKKWKSLENIALAPAQYGEANADLVFVGFGSTKGPILEAMKLLKTKGILSQLLHFSWVYPFPVKEVKQLLTGKKRIIDVEGNGTGQLADLICEKTGINIIERLLKYDGRQWYPEEIITNLKYD